VHQTAQVSFGNIPLVFYTITIELIILGSLSSLSADPATAEESTTSGRNRR